MSAIRFARTCPNCGKMLEIGVDRIGKDFHCYHCGQRFTAGIGTARADAEHVTDERIDRLLDAADRHVARFSFALSQLRGMDQ